MDFTVEMAGIPVRIHCRYETNRAFLEDYLSDREPEAEVTPQEEDLQSVRRGLEQKAQLRGFQYTRISDSYLENLALHERIVNALLPFRVQLLHGSALCLDGEAVIFTAPSGTGKSTQARLWREAFGDRVWMINDDKPLVRITEDRPRVYGSPWDGKHHLSRNASAPLKAVLQVCRSETNRLEPVSPAEAFPVLTRQAYRPQNPADACLSLEMQKEILEKAPFYRLFCNMEPEAAQVARKGVFGS